MVDWTKARIITLTKILKIWKSSIVQNTFRATVYGTVVFLILKLFVGLNLSWLSFLCCIAVYLAYDEIRDDIHTYAILRRGKE
jgi:hypothetical protein